MYSQSMLCAKIRKISQFSVRNFLPAVKNCCVIVMNFGGPSWQRWAPKLVHLSPYEPVPNILRYNFNKELTVDFISFIEV